MIRLRAIGPCEHWKIEQFAILAYGSETVETESDAVICERHQDNKFAFEEELHKGIVIVLYMG